MIINKVYIFSDRIHSGKTTMLQQWLRNADNNVAGILAPDKEGKRCLYDISKDEYIPFEMDEHYPLEETLFIGRYRFSKDAFKKAQNILVRSMHEDPDWLVVDEVGKLEIDDQGLEPGLKGIIEHYKSGQPKGRLILVVRDYLLGAVMDKYHLDTDMVIHKAFFDE